MKSEQELYFETERYIKKQMSPQERQDFEARLQQDPDLAHQVNLQALTHELTFKHRMLQASGVSEQIIATHKSERKYIKYGASGALIFAGALVLYLSLRPAMPLIVEQHQPTVDTLLWQADEQVEQTESVINKQATNISPIKKSYPVQNLTPVVGNTEDTLVVKNLVPAVSEQPSLTKEVPKQDNISNKKLDPCHSVTLHASVHVFETCSGTNEGAVSVSQIKGGKEPYRLKLTSHADQSEKGLSALAQGTYTLVITDQDNCSRTFADIVIPSKKCDTEAQFNPSLGEVWEGPVSNHAAELLIYNHKGHLVHTGYIEALSTPIWDGKSIEGHIQSGVFVYLLKYSDGTQQKGNITLLQ